MGLALPEFSFGIIPMRDYTVVICPSFDSFYLVGREGACSSDGSALRSYAKRREFEVFHAVRLLCAAQYYIVRFNARACLVARFASFVELHLGRKVKHVCTVRPIYGNRLLFRRRVHAASVTPDFRLNDVKIETQTLRGTRRAAA